MSGSPSERLNYFSINSVSVEMSKRISSLTFIALLVVVLAGCGGGTGSTGGNGGASSPSAALPTDFRVFYVRTDTSLTTGEETNLAKYEMILISRELFPTIGRNTWTAVKNINPATDIYVYQGGPLTADNQDAWGADALNNLGRYNTARGLALGALNADHPELFLLDASGARISDNERNDYWCLDFGETTLQTYYSQATLADIANQPWKGDGIFSDWTVPVTSTFGGTAIPAKYATDNAFSAAMTSFIRETTRQFKAAGQKSWYNVGSTRVGAAHDAWVALDASANYPTAIMEEGAFVVIWGCNNPGSGCQAQFFPEVHWKMQIDLMGNIHNSRLTYMSHTMLRPGETGTDQFGKSFTFYDALWYALSSYLIGKNANDNNSFIMFQIPASSITPWFDEYDYIKLGAPLGTYQVRSFNGVNIYWREYEKGYVYVNPTTTDVTGFSLPAHCLQISHDNFKSRSLWPSVTTIDLPAHRGSIVMK
jgi:hypothetical protein